MTGATFLVTGATGRLGPAVVAALTARGDRLLLTGRDPARLARLADEVGVPGRVETLVADPSDPADAQRAAAHAVERFDGLTGLVHLVGHFVPGPLMLTDVGDYRTLLDDNFLSAVVATQAVLPHLGAGGRLVYFTSPLVAEPLAGLSAYAASKAALTTWMRSVAHEVKGRGIHANAVSLTIADTPAMREERPGIDLDHTVRPEHVASAVRFLTGPESEGMYGGVVPVHGRFGFSSALAGGPPAAAARRPDAAPGRPGPAPVGRPDAALAGRPA